ncbi:MAG TPA: LysR family transcriptional regulator [Burkholderiales bacterium]|jgi:DNA-binding transcriptional LysR family regulator
MTSPKTKAAPELLAPDFSLRQISYFVAAAHHQSVNRAAEALHVSPPAISAAIAELERTLGLKLFVRRHARGMVLTEAGDALAVECRNLLGQAWALGAARRGASGELRGSVHLGCLLSFAPFLVPPLVREFRKRYPQARVDWHEGNHEYLMEGLQSGALELAILYDFEVPSGIACLPLRPAPLQAVLPGSHQLTRRKRVSLHELAAEPMVLLDLPRTREYILSAFSAGRLTPRIEYRAQSVMMLRGLVASGLGYSLLNFCPPYTHPGIGTLVTRPLAARLRAPNIVVAHSHRYRPTHAAQALIDCASRLVRELSLTSRPA